MIEIKRRAVRLGLVTAAVVGLAVVPTAALAAGLGAAQLRSAFQQARPNGEGVRPARPAGAAHAERLAAAAAALHVTPEALAAAMAAARTDAGAPDPAQRSDRAAREAHEQRSLEALAARLNVDVTTLQETLRSGRPDPAERKAAARTALVSRLAAQGTLTQAAADAILARFDAWETFGRPRGDTRPRPAHPGRGRARTTGQPARG